MWSTLSRYKVKEIGDVENRRQVWREGEVVWSPGGRYGVKERLCAAQGWGEGEVMWTRYGRWGEGDVMCSTGVG
jgi:hypothetical protein